MSYLLEMNVNPQIAAAALALDTVDACKNHHLTADVPAPGKKSLSLAYKHLLLAKVMREHTERFMNLCNEQSVYSPGDFYKAAIERLQLIRQERKNVALHRREKREREQAEMAQMQADYALIAA